MKASVGAVGARPGCTRYFMLGVHIGGTWRGATSPRHSQALLQTDGIANHANGADLHLHRLHAGSRTVAAQGQLFASPASSAQVAEKSRSPWLLAKHLKAVC